MKHQSLLLSIFSASFIASQTLMNCDKYAFSNWFLLLWLRDLVLSHCWQNKLLLKKGRLWPLLNYICPKCRVQLSWVEQRYFNWTDGSLSGGKDAFGLKVRELDSRSLANVLLSGDIWCKRFELTTSVMLLAKESSQGQLRPIASMTRAL